MTYTEKVLKALKQPEPRMLSNYDILQLTKSTYGEGIIHKIRQLGYDIKHIVCKSKTGKYYYKWFLNDDNGMRVF